MFSIFKKDDNSMEEEQHSQVSMTAREILSALNQMQKELDRLKLAVSGSLRLDLSEEQAQNVENGLARLKISGTDKQSSGSERVVEGVFDGNTMIGADGEVYDVPANYASKSKLVEGDILKLTINNLGAFVYKQIKPIDRLRKVGVLDQDPQNLQFYALCEGKKWKLLTASVTYYKGEPGDEVIFLIPAEGVSRSAAVENIIKK